MAKGIGARCCWRLAPWAGANEEVEIENASRGSGRLTSIEIGKRESRACSPQLTPYLSRLKIEQTVPDFAYGWRESRCAHSKFRTASTTYVTPLDGHDVQVGAATPELLVCRTTNSVLMPHERVVDVDAATARNATFEHHPLNVC